MSAIWDKAKSSALKILGDKGEVPDVPDTIEKAGDSMQKASGEFDKSREDCEAKLLALQNGNDSVRNAMKQFLAKIEKSDLGLDSKNKDDVKKIQQARQLLVGTVNAAIKHYTDDDKMLDELDKHMVQLGKYNPKPAPM